MKNICCAICFFCIGITSIIAETNSNYLFYKTYGGTKYEKSGCIAETKDHGFILSGSTTSFGSVDYDIYLLRLDSIGNTIFTKRYPNSGTEETPKRILVTKDGGYCIGAQIHVVNSNYQYDLYMIKTDSAGIIEWSNSYGIPGTSHWEDAYDLIQTKKSDYIICGYQGSDVSGGGVLYKVNPDGNSPSYIYNDDYKKAFRVIETDDSCLVSVGNKYPGKIHISKHSKTGGFLWTKTYPAGTLNDSPKGLCKASSNGYLIATNYSTKKICLLRVNDQGDTLWTKKYQNMDYASCYVEDMIMTRDSNYIITGHVYSTLTKYSPFLMGVNSKGDSLFLRTYGQSLAASGISVIQCSDDNIAFSGYIATATGSYSPDLFLYKVDYKELLNPITTNNKLTPTFCNSKIFLTPNPVVNILNVSNIPEEGTLHIYNLSGILQLTETVSPNKHTIDTKILPQGFYIADLRTRNGVIWNGKFLKK